MKKFLILASFLLATPALAVNNYYNPQLKNAYVDTCNFYGSDQICGTEAAWTAAHAFCQIKTGGEAIRIRTYRKNNSAPVQKFSLNTRRFEWHTSTWQYVFRFISCS